MSNLSSFTVMDVSILVSKYTNLKYSTDSMVREERLKRLVNGGNTVLPTVILF